VPFTAQSWIADEPRFWASVRDVFRRARRRPRLVVGVALAATALVVGARLARPPVYLATVTFEIAESGLDEAGAAPRPPSAIREHVASLAFGRAQLLALMERHRIAQRWRARDPVAAVDDFREAIGLEVRRNDFLFAPDGDARRSALVLLSFAHPDREVARAILHDIGETVLARQATARLGLLERELETTVALLGRARADLRDLRDGSRAGRAAPRSELERALDRAASLEERASRLERARDGERQGIGLAFERVDEGVAPLRSRLSPQACAALAIGSFCASLALVGVGVGAFDRRVLGAADVVARGFPLLGTVKAP
jgi:hypothetical protein